MEFKGTKGKWDFDEKFNGVFAVEEEIIGNIICLPPEGFDESLENWKSNAKLIASAPELLRALQYIKMACELNSKHAKKNKDKLAYYELSDIASKAINKALN